MSVWGGCVDEWNGIEHGVLDDDLQHVFLDELCCCWHAHAVALCNAAMRGWGDVRDALELVLTLAGNDLDIGGKFLRDFTARYAFL